VQLPRNVDIKWGAAERNAINYLELLHEYSRANIGSIPLVRVDALAGLTSLYDATAIGRPVLMTRNPYIDIDIEAEGIGVWIDAGNDAQWRDTFTSLMSSPERLKKMGEQALRLGREKYNI